MYRRYLRGLVLLAAIIVMTVPAAAQTPASSITIKNVPLPQLYTPGQTITVTVTVTKNDTRDVTAIAVQETIPGTWTYQNVSSANSTMIPIKNQTDIANDDGTKTLSFYYINIPTFPITFTYRVSTGSADSGALSISGMARFRFADAEQQSPVVTASVFANTATEGEAPAEGETGDGTATGCAGCSQVAKDVGTAIGNMFPAALALITLLVLSRYRGQ